ncbi:sensor histidine kinase [Glycomyces buryatensis]|uniref:histidine kinase n=1 Tax=Glycomyces buryatensis TaxID=2570927 RepID=A0A4S8QBG0_9ACTN|nr:sensor histidine kinase [Glycomyces buryatensis]THV41610.1 sensor histidine kinase [Glycomyces buryatensis]
MSKRVPIRRIDLVLGIALLVLSEAVAVLTQEVNSLPPWAWVALGIGPVALVFRRAYPRTVVGIAIVCMLMLAHLQLGALPVLPALVAIATAMYTGYRAWTISMVFGVSFVAAFGFWQSAGFQLTGDVVRNSLLVVGWLHVAMISGESRRQRDAYIAEAEHTKEEAVKRKAADERVRIARELHDSLTHSISVIRVQAGVALHLARKRGEAPASALVAVEEAAKDATRELRETLTMLRDDEGPRLAGLKSLVERYRGSAMEIDIDCGEDEPIDVDPEVDHAAYRIVQEALTNAVRHCDGDRVEVRLSQAEGVLDITVADNGGPGEFTPGRGITGMRERVDSLGGTLTVGRGAYGFTVHAQFPDPAASELTAAAAEPKGDAL